MYKYLVIALLLSGCQNPQQPKGYEPPGVFGFELMGASEQEKPDLCFVLARTYNGLDLEKVSCWHLRKWNGSVTWYSEKSRQIK